MRNILCPIDFSETSIKALLYAYDIALATEASLFLLHTYHIPRVVPLLEGFRQPDAEVHVSYERESLEKMDNLLTWLNKIHAPANVKSVNKTVSNFAVDEVIKTVFEEDIDLIVLGTKTTKDLRSIFFGTNTVRVIEETHRPVLIVPALANYTKINHILYTSHQLHNEEIQWLSHFRKAFNAKISLVQMREKTLAATHQMQAVSENESLVKNPQLLFSYVTNAGQNIQQTIRDFINDHSSTLLAISNNRRQLLDEIIADHTSGQKSYPLLTPVLVLQ